MTYWAIFDGIGEIMIGTLAPTEDECKAKIAWKSRMEWAQIEKQGYRCHKVTITRSNP